jgi:hypothetical protein
MVKFKKRYKIDDLREAQAMNFRIDAITKMQEELRKTNKKLSPNKLNELMDLSSNDVVDLPPEERMGAFEKTGLLNRSFASNKDVMPEPDKQKKNDTKRQAGLNNPKSSVQTGY